MGMLGFHFKTAEVVGGLLISFILHGVKISFFFLSKPLAGACAFFELVGWVRFFFQLEWEMLEDGGSV